MVEMDNYTVQIIHPDEGNNPATSIGKTCASLFTKGELVDCTLSCSDGHLKVHRVVLASVSTYMYNMLTSTPLPSPCSHPILFLRNSTLADVRCAMQFIYSGETQTTKNRLPALLEISQELGCVSLRKAIENCIHACGIEAFKRRMNLPTKSPNKQTMDESTIKNSELGQYEMTSKDSSSSVVDKNEEHNIDRPVVIKEEVFAYDEDGEFHAVHQNQHEGDSVNNKSVNFENEASVRLENDCSSSSHNSSNNTSQSDKLIAESSRRREHQYNKRHGSQSPMGESPEIKKSRGVDLISNSNKFRANQTDDEGVGEVVLEAVGAEAASVGGSDDNSLSSLNFQNEKGESFVYTNDDFEMKSSPKYDQEEDYDENYCYESSREEGTPEHDETELVPPITQKPIISMNDLKEFMKADIRDDDNSSSSVGVPSSCPWCIQVFTSLSLLQKHIRTHVNNYKPFTCDQCHNTFARSAHLKRHMRTHTGEKPYQCNICQRSFARQDKLKTHLERHLNNAAKAANNLNNNYTSAINLLSQNSQTKQQVPIIPGSGKPIKSSTSSKVNINNNSISQKTFNAPSSTCNNNSTPSSSAAASVPISMRFGNNVISTYNGLSISYSPSASAERTPNNSSHHSTTRSHHNVVNVTSPSEQGTGGLGLVVSSSSSAATIPCNSINTTTITPVVIQGSTSSIVNANANINHNNNLTDSTNKRLSSSSSPPTTKSSHLQNHNPNLSLLSFYVASS